MRIEHSLANNRAGFMNLLMPHLHTLQGYARSLAGNESDAADIVQDVLLKLCQHPQRVAEIDELRPWLMRVVYHQFVDFYRRRNASAEAGFHFSLSEDDDPYCISERDVASAEPGPELAAEHSELRHLVGKAISRLPPGQQQLVRLHELQGLSLGEIAQQQQISINTLKSSLARARISLRNYLAGAIFPQPSPLAARTGTPGLFSRYSLRRRRRRGTGDRQHDRANHA